MNTIHKIINIIHIQQQTAPAPDNIGFPITVL